MKTRNRFRPSVERLESVNLLSVVPGLEAQAARHVGLRQQEHPVALQGTMNGDYYAGVQKSFQALDRNFSIGGQRQIVLLQGDLVPGGKLTFNTRHDYLTAEVIGVDGGRVSYKIVGGRGEFADATGHGAFRYHTEALQPGDRYPSITLEFPANSAKARHVGRRQQEHSVTLRGWMQGPYYDGGRSQFMAIGTGFLIDGRLNPVMATGNLRSGQVLTFHTLTGSGKDLLVEVTGTDGHVASYKIVGGTGEFVDATGVGQFVYDVRYDGLSFPSILIRFLDNSAKARRIGR